MGALPLRPSIPMPCGGVADAYAAFVAVSAITSTVTYDAGAMRG